jgi:hypothetical protein
MRPVIVVMIFTLFTCSCEAVSAQQDSDSATNDHPNDGASRPINSTHASNSAVGVPEAISHADVDPMSGQAAGATAQTKKPKPRRKPAAESQMPTIQSVKIGYLDSAIIGSQIRLRFDAAFDMTNSDRAEFFYAKCGCYADIGSPGDPNNDPRTRQFDANAPGPGPGNVTDVNFQQLYLNAEYSPNYHFSVFGEVPVRAVQYLSYGAFFQPPGQEPFKNLAGLSDITAGLKFAILASPKHYLTMQIQASFPSGNAGRGMGTNHYALVPALLYYQKLSTRWAIDSEFGDSHPIGGSAGIPTSHNGGFAGDVLVYGVGPSYELFSGEQIHFTPVLEFVGWTVLGGFQTDPTTGVSADGTNIINIKFGARTSFGAHSSVYFGFGRALTSADWYREIVRAEYRYYF